MSLRPDIRLNRSVLRTAIAVAFGNILFGFHISGISGTVEALRANFANHLDLTITGQNILIGFLVSISLLGAVIGSIVAGRLADRFGRKLAMNTAVTLFIITSIINAFPDFGVLFKIQPVSWIIFSIISFSGSRFISGCALGIISTIIPLYISEISPAKIRGRLVALSQMGVVTGILVAFIINYLIESSGDTKFLYSWGWRLMFVSEAIPSIITIFLFIRIPESPRYLYNIGQVEEAKRIFSKYLSTSELYETLKSLETVSRQSKKGVPLNSYGKRVLFVGLSIAMLQPLTGINAILFYTPEILKRAVGDITTAFFQSTLVGLINFITTIVAIFIIERAGRKKFYFNGGIGMFVCLIIVGFLFFLGASPVLILGFLFLFIIAFAITWGPITWVMASEIFPSKISAKALSLGIAGQWLVNYLIAWTFPVIANSPSLVKTFRYAFPFWLYALLIIIPTVIVLVFSPETKGKSLEEIEKYWESKN
ncbi:MAG: sugar porter family MFS transporter [Hyphomicrobiales bacterium]